MGIMTTRMLMHLRKVALHSHRASTFTRSEFMGDSMLMDASDLYNQKFAAPDSIKTIGGSSRESTRFSARQARGRGHLTTDIELARGQVSLRTDPRLMDGSLTRHSHRAIAMERIAFQHLTSPSKGWMSSRRSLQCRVVFIHIYKGVNSSRNVSATKIERNAGGS
jgi:hypothetical protein